MHYFRLLLSFAFLTWVQPTYAQTAHLRGQVTDSLGIPVPFADVIVLGQRLAALTDSQGLFRIPNIPPGDHLIQVRAIGWKPLLFEISLKAGDEWVGRIGLESAPVILPAIEVTGRYGKPARYANTTRFDDFYRRRRFGLGAYLERDQVDAAIGSGARGVLNLVERMNLPGVRVTQAGISFARCQGRDAKVGVWIDGAKVPNPGTRPMPELATLLDVRDVEAVEVYRGVAQIPGEFLDDSCAAIVIWTRY